MKLPSLIFLMALPCLLFFSCQKEIHGDVLPATAKNDSTVLWKYIEFDTIFPPGQDTTSIYTFFYDNLKRIKQIQQVKNFPRFPGAFTYYITTDFFYSGSSALPYKTIELDKEGITYVDTSFYTYSNGLVSTDSSVNYSINDNEFLFANIISFSATGNNVFVKVKEIYPSSVYQDSATLTITRQNGNIVTQQDPDNKITYSKQLKYDNNINPFYGVDIHYPIFYEHLINSFGAQKNNITEEIDFTNLAGTASHVYNTYTYRDDGYPLVVKKIDLLVPAENRKGLFFYIK
jgi:hypothetical protein